MTHVTCRLTAKNWDQLWNPTLGNRTFTFYQLTARHTSAKRSSVRFRLVRTSSTGTVRWLLDIINSLQHRHDTTHLVNGTHTRRLTSLNVLVLLLRCGVVVSGIRCKTKVKTRQARLAICMDYRM